MDNIRRVSFVRFKKMKNDVDTLFFFLIQSDDVSFCWVHWTRSLAIAVEYNAAEQVAHADFFFKSKSSVNFWRHVGRNFKKARRWAPGREMSGEKMDPVWALEGLNALCVLCHFIRRMRTRSLLLLLLLVKMGPGYRLSSQTPPQIPSKDLAS